MKLKKLSLILATVAATALSSSAHAATVFAGSWKVYNAAAPMWSAFGTNGPLAYTGQEAAALLFGGNAAQYRISTVDNLVANINNKSWYDVIGFGARELSESYNNKYLGQFYGPQNGPWNGANAPASAFVRDNLSSHPGVNFAFRVDTTAVPEPATWAMMIAGFGLVGAGMRRRQTSVRITYA